MSAEPPSEGRTGQVTPDPSSLLAKFTAKVVEVPATPEGYEQVAEQVREITGDKAAQDLRSQAANLRRWYAYIEEHGLRPLPFQEAAQLYADAREQAWDEAPRSLVDLGHRLSYSSEVLELEQEEQDRLAGEYFMGQRRVVRRSDEILKEAGYAMYPRVSEVNTRWGMAPLEQHALAEIPEGATIPPFTPSAELEGPGKEANPSKRPKREPPTLYAGTPLEPTWSPFPIGAAVEAQMRSTDWTPQQRGAMRFPLAYSKATKWSGREYTVYLSEARTPEAKSTSTPQPLTQDVSLEICRRFGIIHARLFIGLGIATRKAAKTTQGRVRLNEADLLRIAGLKDESHLTTSQKLEMIDRALKHIGPLCYWITPGPRDNKQVLRHGGHFYYVSSMPTIEQPIKYPFPDGVLGPEAQMIGLTADVAPGPMLYDMIESGSFQDGYVPQGVLEIPPQKYALASRVGLWCAIHWWEVRDTKAKGTKHKRELERVDSYTTIGEILRAVIPEHEPQEEWEQIGYTWTRLREDRYARHQVMNQVENMPPILERYGLRLEVTFPARARGVYRSWDDFLEIPVRWTLVGGVEAEELDRRAGPPDIPPTGLEITERMEKLDWSGKKLAQVMGVSQTMVSYWRTDKRRISDEHLRELKRLLDLP